MADMDYSQCIEIVEAAMEWIALRWSKSQMKRELRDWFPGLSGMTCDFIFSAAKKEIRKRYNIDPDEYKGKAIAFYEYVIRGDSKMRDKLTAAERLDKLYGLEQLQHEDADTTARKIREALIQIEDQIEGVPDDVKQNYKPEGEGEINAGTNTDGQQRTSPEETAESKEAKEGDKSDAVPNPSQSDNIPEEVVKDLKEIKPDTVEDFLKGKKKKRES